MMKAIISILTLLVGVSVFAEEDKLGLTNETGLGYVVTGGNSQSETTSINERLVQKWDNDILRFNGHYIQAEGYDPSARQKIQTAENWTAAARFERVLDPNVFNLFVGHGWRGNRFQGVREAHDSDLGAKYYLLHSQTWVHVVELGYRYTRELYTVAPPAGQGLGVGDPINPELHFLRTFTKLDYNYSKSFSIGFWLEYQPSITNFSEDQRINFSPYLVSVLTDILSLKFSYENRYRFKPAVEGKETTDYFITTSLIAKF